MLPTEKDPQSPATTSFEWDYMAPSWDRIDTLLGGTRAMREAGATYLPQHAEESEDNYNERLNVNILFNAMEITLDHFVGRPFSEDVKFNEDVPEAIQEQAKNIDLQGSNITNFCREWFREGLAKAFCHVLIDMPALNEEARTARTRADDLSEGRRPFWQLIKPENMIYADADISVDPQTGELREKFTHVRLYETVVEREGFAQVVRERIRVIEPGYYWVYEKQKTKKRREEWRVIEEGSTGINFVPIVTYYSNRTGFLRGKPPLEDLAYLNIRHWQSMSDQINILTVVRFPMLAVAGATEQSGGTMRIGPRQLLQTKDPNGRFYYVEHTGKSIESGWAELEGLEDDMEAYGATFLKKKPGNETATGRALDSAESVTPLQDMVMRFTDAVNNALAIHATWMKLKDGGTVDILSDFNDEEVSKEDSDLLRELRKMRDISRKAMLSEMQRRGTLSEDYDAEEDIEQLKKEEKDFKDITIPVPGLFDPSEGEGSPKGRPGSQTGGGNEGDDGNGSTDNQGA